ncbi:MAG: GlxA family transcriptional regulator, partial [Solirubrobacterales bacterium]|nr:GlxA family transcriptional regulator [Solirubrobacterales bacterium]
MSSPQSTVVVAFDGVQGLDVTGPWEVLHTAGLIAGRPAGLRLVSADGEGVRTESGLELAVDGAIDSVEAIDTLLVAGGLGTRQVVADERLIAGIGRLAGLARRTASVCTGALLLAEAGVLDGRRATTHWGYCAEFADRYPKVDVDPDPIFIRDGDVYTSAGVTAGMDLALALVEEDHGRETALRVARMLVLYARRPGGQSQFSVQLSHGTAEGEPLRELQAWITEHLEEDLSVGALAGRMHLSERQLSRIFSREIGATPADYVEQIRIQRARALLEGGQIPVEGVAARCGFPSPEVMRRAFARRLGASP